MSVMCLVCVLCHGSLYPLFSKCFFSLVSFLFLECSCKVYGWWLTCDGLNDGCMCVYMYVCMYNCVGDGLGVCCVLCCYCVHAHNCIIVLGMMRMHV